MVQPIPFALMDVNESGKGGREVRPLKIEIIGDNNQKKKGYMKNVIVLILVFLTAFACENPQSQIFPKIEPCI